MTLLQDRVIREAVEAEAFRNEYFPEYKKENADSLRVKRGRRKDTEFYKYVKEESL